jgi:hypothetical protein
VAARPSLAALGGVDGTSGIRRDGGGFGAAGRGGCAGRTFAGDDPAPARGSVDVRGCSAASGRSGSHDPGSTTGPAPSPTVVRRDCIVLNSANPMPQSNPSRSPNRKERLTMSMTVPAPA